MPIIPAAEFAPDMPDVPSETTDAVYNVVPLTPVSYGPLPSLQSFSTALTARCQGAISVQDTSANVRIFAGDATKLYRLTSASTTPADVSKVGGYTANSSGIWSFTLFGSRVIATDFNDAPQSYVEGSSALFADLITSGFTSLKAKYVATVKEWVVFANTTDGTFGAQPQRVWWSAINDPTNFPTPGTTAAAVALSDYQDVPGPHGQIMGILGNLGTADAAVFFERAVWRMVFAGLPDIFNFSPAEGARGLIAPGALVQWGPLAFYMGEDGFYMFDGSQSKPIGRFKVDQYVYNDLNQNFLDRISSAVDPKRGLIFWSYPNTSAASGVPNRLLIYNVPLDRWSITEANATMQEWLVRGATFGKTLEQLDSFGTIDTLAYSLDSNVWSGGRSALAGFDSSHKFGYFDGSNLQAKIDSSDMELIPGRQTLLNAVRPLVDTSSATLSVAPRDRLADLVTYSGTYAIVANGTVPVRARGRYQRVRTTIPAAAAWNQFSGVDIDDFQDMGSR